MTKKTNSLLFRLGINSLWSSKLSNLHKIFNSFRLEQALCSELVKRKWNILSIKWYSTEIIIQIYSNFSLSKNFKRNLFNYFKKLKSIKKFSEKFSINSVFIINMLKKIHVNKIKFKTNLLIQKTNVFSLLFKNWKLKVITKILFHSNYFNWFQINSILSCCKEQLKQDFFLFYYCNSKILLFNKLQKINGFIYFKILSILIENTIFNVTKTHKDIHLINIWCNNGWIFKFLYKKKGVFLLQLLFLSCFYNNIKIFSEFIALQLKKNKNHKKILKQITLIIETFWKKKKINLRGIQLWVSGKLNGKMRKSKYHYTIGKVQLQTLKTFLNYNLAISYTKFGIISIKFWVLYGNKKI